MLSAPAEAASAWTEPASPTVHAQARSGGLYVWNAGVAVERAEDAPAARRRLLAFCASRGVTRLYLAVDPVRWEPEPLGALLAAARAQGLSPFAVPPRRVQDAWLRGFRLLRRCDHGAVLGWLRGVAALREGGGFAGVQLDLEPHAGAAWRWARGGLRDPRNLRLAQQLLDLLERVRAEASAASPPLRMAVTIPTWFDRDGPAESFVLARGGREGPLSAHVAARADFVTVMDYVDGATPESRDRAWRDVADEVASGPVEVLFETQRPRRRRHPLPDETLYEEGEAGYAALCGWVAGWFAGHPNFLGCAAHHWGDAVGSGLPGW